jgi:hypothetical protein
MHRAMLRCCISKTCPDRYPLVLYLHRRSANSTKTPEVAKMKMEKREFICSNCGGKSERYMREGQDRAFCSRSCFNEYKGKNKIIHYCKTCGCEYVHTKTYLGRGHCENCPPAKRKPRRISLRQATCNVCGKTDMVRANTYHTYYCSPKCSQMAILVKRIRAVANVS